MIACSPLPVLAVLTLYCSTLFVHASDFRDTNYSAPLNLTAAQDHQQMMDLLHITSLRRGADGMNPQSPNYQNTDESRANPYPILPDPLMSNKGTKVTTAESWWKQRRPEILEYFDRDIYGRVPPNTPKVNWEVVKTTRETNGTIPVITKQIAGRVDNSFYPLLTVTIDLTLTTPAAANGPVPVIMEFGFRNFGGRAGARAGTNNVGSTNWAPRGPGTNGPRWQQQLLAKGWGYAILVPTSFQADTGAGLTKGIIGLCNRGQSRKPDDWGALRAWAWGASRALDFFETAREVDATRVGIEGLSRYGKAAIVTMAYDPRFAIAFVGSSGEGGAKLHRRNWGELVENLTGSGEYHWMAGNFLKYGGPLNPGDLPVDAHELIALCAPRPVFISYGASSGPGAEGTWVDQKGSFMAAVAAGPVYRLLGKKDLGTTEFPPVETALVEGEVAWRQHSGGHTTGPNWPTFLKWSDRYVTNRHWVGTWGCAPQLTEPRNLPPVPLANSTLRQFVHVTIRGNRLRARLSNAHGTNSVNINAARLALASGSRNAGNASINTNTDRALKFSGAESVVIPPGETIWSDSLDFNLPPLTNLAVSIYFGSLSPTTITGHPGARTTSFIIAGNAVSAPSMARATNTAHWYIITGIDVLADFSSRALVVLGDSITDGRGSTTDGNDRWPDQLASRMATNLATAKVGVLNMGIGGNGILGGLGPSAQKRFDRDVLKQRGAHWLIIFEGVNDIGGGRTETALINAYSELIEKARARNISAYGVTITPFGGNGYYTDAHERTRQAVNNWIRTSGKYDTVIDFDATVRDPASPTNLLSAYDSGDGLHLSPAGYKAMADAIDLRLFTR